MTSRKSNRDAVTVIPCGNWPIYQAESLQFQAMDGDRVVIRTATGGRSVMPLSTFGGSLTTDSIAAYLELGADRAATRRYPAGAWAGDPINDAPHGGSIEYRDAVADNTTRAAFAAHAVRRFQEIVAPTGEHPETLVGDLLADLMHLADSAGFDFDHCVRLGWMHYDAEVAGEDYPNVDTGTPVPQLPEVNAAVFVGGAVVPHPFVPWANHAACADCHGAQHAKLGDNRRLHPLP